jgi:hypothetical protein
MPAGWPCDPATAFPLLGLAVLTQHATSGQGTACLHSAALGVHQVNDKYLNLEWFHSYSFKEYTVS